VVWLAFKDGEMAMPALIASGVGLAAGPVIYFLIRLPRRH